MKKTTAVSVAFLMCLALTFSAFADLIAPAFTEYDVVITNPDGAVTTDGDTIPCGIVLTVYGEYYEDSGTILTCYYKGSNTSESVPMMIKEADTEKADGSGSEQTSGTTLPTTMKPAQKTSAPVTENAAENVTSEPASESATGTTAVSESITDESASSEETAEETDKEETEKSSNSAMKKCLISACISAAVAATAIVTIVFVRKKHNT